MHLSPFRHVRSEEFDEVYKVSSSLSDSGSDIYSTAVSLQFPEEVAKLRCLSINHRRTFMWLPHKHGRVPDLCRKDLEQ